MTKGGIKMGFIMRCISMVLAMLITLVLFSPTYSSADSDLLELEGIIKDINAKQTGPEKVGNIEDKLMERYGHVVDPSEISRLIKEVTPGEAITLVVFMKLLDKTDTKVVEMKKAGLSWDKISEKVSISLQKVVKTIKLFRKSAC